MKAQEQVAFCKPMRTLWDSYGPQEEPTLHTLDLQPPELGEIIFLSFKPPSPWPFVTAEPAN